MKKRDKIFLGADHAGFSIKEKLKGYLLKKGFAIEDLSKRYKEGDDYPDYAIKLGEKIAKSKNAKGILICGTGSGMTIAANKVEGIRAVAAYDTYSAKMSREHNDTNVLGLRGREFPFNKIKKIVDVWLNSEFSNADRHKRRLRKISAYERER